MSLTQALSSASAGLRVSQAIAGSTSTNIANASTPGYVRREANLSSLVLNGFGAGVDVSILRANVNEFLIRDTRLEQARVSYNQVQSQALQSYSSILGQPQDPLTIANSIRDLEISFQTLFDDPNSTTRQRGVLTAAQQITQDLARLTDAVQDQRLEADQAIGRAVDEVNSALFRIDELNLAILEFEAAGRETTDLVDERDRLIDDISEKLPIRTFERPDGELVIFTTQGVSLLDGRVKPLDYTAASVVTAQQVLDDGIVDNNNDGIPDTGFTGSLSGLTVDGFEISTESPGNQNITTGEIAGLFTLRDNTLVRFQEQLDALAVGLIQTFQDPAVDPSLNPGPPPEAGLFTDAGAVFDPTINAGDDRSGQIVGLAGRLQINPLGDPDQGGNLARFRDGFGTLPNTAGNQDTTQIQRFLDALTSSAAANYPVDAGGNSLSGSLDLDQSLFGFSASLIDDQQGERSRVTDAFESRQVILTVLSERRINENGVNVDFETQLLLQVEQAYSANATVIEAARDMFDRLLAIRN